MAITKTRNQLINKALENLHVIGTGQSAEADDHAKMDEVVDPLLEQLAVDEVVEIANPDEIPNAIFLPLAELLANAAASGFSQDYDPNKKMVFEAVIRRLTASRATGETLRTVYY